MERYMCERERYLLLKIADRAEEMAVAIREHVENLDTKSRKRVSGCFGGVPTLIEIYDKERKKGRYKPENILNHETPK